MQQTLKALGLSVLFLGLFHAVESRSAEEPAESPTRSVDRTRSDIHKTKLKPVRKAPKLKTKKNKQLKLSPAPLTN